MIARDQILAQFGSIENLEDSLHTQVDETCIRMLLLEE
jgi:hypothetical protein